MMPESNHLALLLIGLLGAPHCAAMCGGLVGALSASAQARWNLHLAYNGGRIVSYAVGGALAGSVGEAGIALAGTFPLRNALYLLANLMLIAMGLHLAGATRILGMVENAGQHLWRYVQPFSRRFLPARRATQAFPLGLLWGWLPCGLVYSALATALVSGSMCQGASLMLAFGVGTLPNLLLAGMLASRLQGHLQHPATRIVSGLLVLTFGIWGLLRMLQQTPAA